MKYVKLDPSDLKGNIKIQLYNPDNNIQEQHDVAAEHPQIEKQIKQL